MDAKTLAEKLRDCADDDNDCLPKTTVRAVTMRWAATLLLSQDAEIDALRAENAALKQSRHAGETCTGKLAGDPPRYVPDCAALRADAERARQLLTACIVGINHMDRMLREWEPDHSSGADRQQWVKARDARDDADVWCRLAARTGGGNG